MCMWPTNGSQRSARHIRLTLPLSVSSFWALCLFPSGFRALLRARSCTNTLFATLHRHCGQLAEEAHLPLLPGIPSSSLFSFLSLPFPCPFLDARFYEALPTSTSTSTPPTSVSSAPSSERKFPQSVVTFVTPKIQRTVGRFSTEREPLDYIHRPLNLPLPTGTMMFMGRLLCVLSPLVIVVFVIVRAVTLPETPHPRPLVAVPAFRLFPPNAAISLTEDNSTFFPARPAAFGPELPDDGLSAILWIGAGFGEDGVEPQGELGCSDVPGWNGRRAADGVPILPTDKKLDDGTDNYLEDFATGHYYRHPRRSARAKAVPAVDKGAAAAAVHPVQATAAAIDMTTPPLPPPEHSAKLLSPVKAKAAANSNSEGSPGNIQSLQEGAEIAGKIVLLRRGGCGFFAKVMWAQRRGAVAVIVGDDRKGGPLIQMYASGDTSAVLIPSVFTAHTTAHLLTALAESAVLDDQDADTKEKEAHAGGNAEARTKMVVPPTAETGDDGAWFWRKRPREWVLEDYVPPETPAGTDGAPVETRRQLYVTISPSRGGLPLIDTLLVLVASPLLAIVTITCVLLFLRTQCRRRAWRAPKALVEQLPVHIYRPPGAPPPSPLLVPVGSEVASPNPSRPSSPTLTGMHPTVTTPLLQRPRSRTTTGVPGDERRVMVSVPAPPPPQSRYFQSECVVCLEDYVAGDRVMCLPCGHEFHEACITPWLTTRRRTCPICKGDIVRTASGEAA